MYALLERVLTFVPGMTTSPPPILRVTFPPTPSTPTRKPDQVSTPSDILK
jgi:hypothetical protein